MIVLFYNGTFFIRDQNLGKKKKTLKAAEMPMLTFFQKLIPQMYLTLRVFTYFEQNQRLSHAVKRYINTKLNTEMTNTTVNK